MKLKATLTIDLHGLEEIVREHVAAAGYVLEELDVRLHEDQPELHCDVRPMTREEADAVALETRSPEERMHEMLRMYTEEIQEQLMSLEDAIRGANLGAETPKVSSQPASLLPSTVRVTHLNPAAKISAEAAAARKSELRKQMQAEALLVADPIESFEEYPHD
jgi:HPt (histidine-containing phosphotransfer) domain-containing protein